MLQTEFFFQLTVNNHSAQFQEISGLNTEQVSATEGLSNAFALPKGLRSANLILKRGLMPGDTPLSNWIINTLAGSSKHMITPDMRIDLLDATGQTVAAWIISKAFPIRVEVQSNSDNILIISSLEFTYTALEKVSV